MQEPKTWDNSNSENSTQEKGLGQLPPQNFSFANVTFVKDSPYDFSPSSEEIGKADLQNFPPVH